jgi:predicted dienelactone hydrolase
LALRLIMGAWDSRRSDLPKAIWARAALLAAVLLSATVYATASFAAVGYQQVTIPDREGKSIQAGIWYPSNTQTAAHPLGMFTQEVALNGPIAGQALPLILILHGTSGSLSSHFDTAHALARAGFVVVALTHIGDNTQDRIYIGNRIDLIDRPRQAKTTLDWILSSWPGRLNVNPRRIGVYGFSLGGFTGLVLIGGTPEIARMAQLCDSNESAPECAFIKNAHGNQLTPSTEAPVWIHDTRIKAAVIAAPAAGYLFGPADLREVSVPIQLWRVENDSQAPDAWNGAVIRDNLKVHPDSHLVQGADHFVFLAPGSDALAAAATQICRDPPGFDRAAFHRAFNQSVVEFFTTALRER